ncbi:MAG TPA: PIN domain-containing protein [Acidobacteriaceae bacterium]
MQLSSCLLDTNILVRITKSQSSAYPEVAGAVNELLSSGVRLFYTHQNVAELWNVMTRPVNANGLGLGPEQADAEVRAIERFMGFLPEGDLAYQYWRQLLVQYKVRGVQVHDARLVATMLANSFRHILTLNIAHFARFTEIIAIHPRTLPQNAQ